MYRVVLGSIYPSGPIFAILVDNMAMRRTTLILLIVLVVVVIGAAALYLMFPDKVNEVFSGKKTSNTNTTTTVNTNTVSVPTNLSTTQDLSGDTALTGSIKVGATTVSFTSFDRVDTFDQTPAPANQQYVIMYFEGIDGAATNAVFNALDTAQMVSGDNRYSRGVLKVATNIVKNDRGYIVFVVPVDSQQLTLEVGSGANVQQVKLP